jgi:hypothetical protein
MSGNIRSHVRRRRALLKVERDGDVRRAQAFSLQGNFPAPKIVDEPPSRTSKQRSGGAGRIGKTAALNAVATMVFRRRGRADNSRAESAESRTLPPSCTTTIL